MANYLANNDEFRLLTGFPFVEELEAKSPGTIMAISEAMSSDVDARLIKRGDVPFQTPVPKTVKMWVATMSLPGVWRALGRLPSDEQQSDISKAADRVYETLKEAADPVNGLLLLPLQKGSKVLQANDEATLSSSEQSPYSWRHKQADAVRGNRRYG